MVLVNLGNYGINFFIFRHRFHIMRPIFRQFERGQNAAKKFQIGNNKSEKLQDSTKLDKIIV